MEAPERDRLLRPLQVQEELGVSPTTLREWVGAGRLRAAQRTIGGHRRYRESEVLALLAELKAAA